MPDPRFDGSLDAPTFLDRGEHVEVLCPTLVSAAPPEPEAPKGHPLCEWARHVEVIPPDSDLEILVTSFDGLAAIERAREALQDECSEGYVIAAGVMLADWNESSLVLAPDSATVRAIRARLERGWIRMPLGYGKSFLRASWLANDENGFAFVLDTMVAYGDIRRTWGGLYCSRERYEEPWRGHAPREALEILLGAMSGTARALAMQFAASDIESGYTSSVRGNLANMEKRGKAMRVETFCGVMWTAA